MFRRGRVEKDPVGILSSIHANLWTLGLHDLLNLDCLRYKKPEMIEHD
jgi:hypothetical protein